MPTTVTYTVDTGGTGDYTSLSAWESAQQQDLTSTDRIMVVECKASGGAADTARLDIFGWTADATRYMIIRPTTSNRHDGVWDAAKYRLAPTVAGFSGAAPYVQVSHLIVDGLQQSSSHARGFQFNSIASLLMKNCILQSSSTLSGMVDLESFAASGVADIRNNLFQATGSTTQCIIKDAASSTANVDNNTLVSSTVGTTIGISRTGGTLVARNNIVNGFSDSYSGTFSAGTDYNATDRAETPGVGSNNLQSQTFSFVNSGAGNYRLTNSLAGVDLSGTFTDDIIGTVRPQGAEFDIGCFERVAAGSPWYAHAQM